MTPRAKRALLAAALPLFVFLPACGRTMKPSPTDAALSAPEGSTPQPPPDPAPLRPPPAPPDPRGQYHFGR